MLLGVDVGGTFTDAVLVDGDRILTGKAPSTPRDQSEGVIAAVEAVLATAGASAGDVRRLAHGMTVATNALLEGTGARTALVTTEGFTDLVELGRQARADLYRLCARRPAPLVPPERRVGAAERTGPDGVERALGEDGAAEVARAVAALEPEAVAVCLLHADRFPEHERAIGAALAGALGDTVAISLSHEVVGTFREFERAATTEVDAALSPLLAAYLRRLRGRCDDAGLPVPAIMQSSGGLASLELAAAHASYTVLSGPAGGAAAAMLIAEATGERDLVCFDMGGTSCDVCVIEDGRVRETSGREVAGRPLALPMVDIHTVGAGGGSIAWRDAGGALRAGPRSAGAEPGPACYGRGGTEPTVTDAHVVLGHLGTDEPLAGGVELDGDAAQAAVARLAEALGLELEACAEGILRVADAEMVRALRVMTVERGIDPRGFALLAFGGAGGLHGARIADELGIRRVLVPHAGGVLSALGLAAAERRATVNRTLLLRGDALTDAALTAAWDELGDEAAAQLGDAGEERRWTVEARYRGQAHELELRGVERSAAAVRAALAAAHEERYGYAGEDRDAEVVSVRVTASVPGPGVALRGERRDEVSGPVVIPLPETTVLVPAGWSAAGDDTGTLVLERR